jgi:hypothetical protein
MNKREKLDRLADELRPNVEHRLDLALLTIVEALADLNKGDSVNYSCGNIGITFSPSMIELVDIEKGTRILGLEVKYGK